jgi:hypothetical protein
LQERELDAAWQQVVTARMIRMIAFVQKQKSGLLRPHFRKEAKGEGKSLREGDAQCSPGLRRDTQIEEVSNLGRWLKSLNFTASLVC